MLAYSRRTKSSLSDGHLGMPLNLYLHMCVCVSIYSHFDIQRICKKPFGDQRVEPEVGDRLPSQRFWKIFVETGKFHRVMITNAITESINLMAF